MTCQEFKELAPIWAVGGLDAAEEEACATHLATPRLHQGCESAVAVAEQAAQLLVRALSGQAPPERVWEGIEAKLFDEAKSDLRRGSRLPRWSRVARAVAVAATLAVVFLLLGHQLGSQEARRAGVALHELETRSADERSLARTALESCRHDLQSAGDALAERERALALLAEPSTELIGLAPQADFKARGSVIFNPSKHQAMVFAGALAPAVNGDYELWVIRGETKIPAGLLKVQAGGSALAPVDERLLQSQVNLFAVTLEPAGGSQSPRGPLVLVGSVKKG